MQSSGRVEEYENVRKNVIGNEIGLYDECNLLRIVRECTDITISKGSDLKPKDFNHLDLLHYQGHDSLELFCKNHELEGSHCIDLGAGIGGTSRYLASSFNCNVRSIELSTNIAGVGKTLNVFLNMTDKVEYTVGDLTRLFSDYTHWNSTFDFGFSQLVFLHISNKDALFQSISSVMKSGALVYIEDFFKHGNGDLVFSEHENRVLKDDISVPVNSLLTVDEYKSIVKKYGFEIEEWNDKTKEWTEFVWNRYENYLQQEHSTCSQLAWFYQQMTYLYHFKDYLSKSYPLVEEQLQKIHGSFLDESRNQVLGGVQCVLRKI